MMRREFIALLGGAAATWPVAARAQKSLPRIGWLVFGDAKKMGPVDQSLKDALVQAGLLDGRNIEIVFRYANGMPDRLAELATELVAQRPNLLLAVGGDVIKSLFEASKGSIPAPYMSCKAMPQTRTMSYLMRILRSAGGGRSWSPSCSF
jgi:putative ABC transport system substrate-binding protein